MYLIDRSAQSYVMNKEREEIEKSNELRADNSCSSF